jgi:hypothetical protein
MAGFNYKTDTKKGRYDLINPAKYMGTSIPVYKSKWEQRVFFALDKNPFILRWGYECIDIFYHHPLYMQYTKYLPDIYCEVVMQNNTNQKFLIEIKPSRFCTLPKEPKMPKKGNAQASQRYQKSLMRYEQNKREYLINMCKWEAAQLWCLKNNVVWKVLNENNTNGLFK